VAPLHVLREPAVDVVVRGEAERTVVALTAALQEGATLDALPGLAFRCGEGWCRCARVTTPVHLTPAASMEEELDLLPAPSDDLVDLSDYGGRVTVITSRGCPFSCSFCTVHATVGKAFRARAPERVVDEIEHYVREHGVHRFSIEDDNFTFDIPRVRRICAEITARGLDIDLDLPNGMTVVKLDEELVREMYQAGFRSLFLGLETTDPQRLRHIRKGFTSLAKVRRGAGLFADEGVEVGASLIVGLPGQDIRSVAEDSRNAARAGIRFWTNPFYPIPGSADFTECLRAGLISPDTDYALFDQFNFAIGSTRLQPIELYWAWVLTQAIAQWPGLVLTPQPGVAVPDALARLVAHVIEHGLVEPPLEVPAAPVESDGTQVRLHPTSCFCAMHGVQTLDPPAELCRFSGDVVAAAVSLVVGRAVMARPVGRHPRGCRFVVEESADAVWSAIVAEFLDVLAESESLALGAPGPA
jgi:radical SAM superfamily enzyme YgiQ (UPF0313 family)